MQICVCAWIYRWTKNCGKSGLLSIMPNRPVRDKWYYPRKMERHFPIKPRQPIRNSSCHFLSFPNSLIRAKNRFVKNGTANFDRNIPTEISGPPPKVIPNIPVGRNRNGPFHLNSDRNFRNLWHNGKHPRTGPWAAGPLGRGGPRALGRGPAFSKTQNNSFYTI